MSGERRTAEDALALTGEIRQFISSGPAVPKSPKASADNSTDDGDTGRRARLATSNAPKRTTTESPRRRSQPKATSRSHAKSVSLSEPQLTHIKATVQKTVRFKPALIAKLEAWVKDREARGVQVPSFQQIQNEALGLWLDSNVKG